MSINIIWVQCIILWWASATCAPSIIDWSRYFHWKHIHWRKKSSRGKRRIGTLGISKYGQFCVVVYFPCLILWKTKFSTILWTQKISWLPAMGKLRFYLLSFLTLPLITFIKDAIMRLKLWNVFEMGKDLILIAKQEFLPLEWLSLALFWMKIYPISITLRQFNSIVRV